MIKMKIVKYTVEKKLVQKNNSLYFKDKNKAKEMAKEIKDVLANHGFKVKPVMWKEKLPNGKILFGLNMLVFNFGEGYRYYIYDYKPAFSTESVETISKKEAEQEIKRFIKETKEATKFFNISARIRDELQNFEVVG